ncbi:hypothetical protein B0H17DRAFT_1197304 [Mycena rosella]|uniref:Uncharacterized protein n=1 Tax=Mycena rosella TaxID=1033263 RepID=A0AAD7DRG6_MYCRO|nr:hypothetical protein B0H17DRAFT_1197304 [Mycena rosella]
MAAFSTTSLRRLELRDQRFESPHDLHHILSNSVGLKELVPIKIGFTHSSPRPAEIRLASPPPRVVLESLEILYMDTHDIDAVLTTFTVVDITHLRSIHCDRYHKPLFQANAHSIQRLTLVVHYTRSKIQRCARSDPFSDHEPPQPRPEDKLHYISSVADMIRQLGNLAGLKSLKQLSITAPRGINPVALA